MPTAKKFMFETSFGETESEMAAKEAALAVELEKNRQREEAMKKAAHKEGFDEGVAAGYDKARDEAEQLSAQAMGDIAGQLGSLIDSQTEALEEIRRVAVSVALSVVSKVLPEMGRRNGLGEIEGLIRNCLNRVLGEPQVIVRINEKVLPHLEKRTEKISHETGYNGKIVLVANNQLSDGDCRIEWADGIAERDMGLLWKELEETIGRYLNEEGPEGMKASEGVSADPEAVDGEASLAPPPLAREENDPQSDEAAAATETGVEAATDEKDAAAPENKHSLGD